MAVWYRVQIKVKSVSSCFTSVKLATDTYIKAIKAAKPTANAYKQSLSAGNTCTYQIYSSFTQKNGKDKEETERRKREQDERKKQKEKQKEILSNVGGLIAENERNSRLKILWY